jgi:hypothetical protein
MYRFSIDGSNWILRFSPNLEMEDDEKEEIIQSMVHLGPKLRGFSHGDSFLVFDKESGGIVFMVEKVPSLIVTVMTVVPEEQWFVKKSLQIEPYSKK